MSSPMYALDSTRLMILRENKVHSGHISDSEKSFCTLYPSWKMENICLQPRPGKEKKNCGDDCALKMEALQGDRRLRARTGFTPPLT